MIDNVLQIPVWGQAVFFFVMGSIFWKFRQCFNLSYAERGTFKSLETELLSQSVDILFLSISIYLL